MRTKIVVSEISFLPGWDLTLEENVIVIIIGPNNVGKSLLLKELLNCIQNNTGAHDSHVIIDKITLERRGSVQEFRSDLMEHSVETDIREIRRFADHEEFQTPYMDAYWDSQSSLGNISKLFVKSLFTENRIKLSDPTPQINYQEHPPSHPYHLMYLNGSLEKKLARIAHRALGQEVFLNRLNGINLPMMYGKLLSEHLPTPNLSLDYMNKVALLPKLQNQGDGIRSFIGVAANIINDQHSILIIDEPEAFLHPPQQKIIGKLISEEAKNKQVFVATHSLDFIKGIIGDNNKTVKIIRLDRQTENEDLDMEIVMPDKILEIANNSLLKYTNILDGLFHEQLIICEGDSDCRFFQAILDSLPKSESKEFRDTLFTYCGGKDRFLTIIPILKEFGMRTKIIADFDILNDETRIQQIFIALGGDWASIKEDYKNLENSIRQMGSSELLKQKLQEKLKLVLEESPSPKLTKREIDECRKLFHFESGWENVKLNGKHVLRGAAVSSFLSIQKAFQTLGLYILDVGQIESFYKEINLHGPRWVEEILARDLIDNKEFNPAREFVAEVMG